MADVKIVDIDNVQWNMKDQEARNKIAALEENFNYLTTYSTNETLTGEKWIDSKPIYRKVVDVGTLTNKTSKNVLHNIQNINNVVNLKLIAKDSVNNIVSDFGGKDISIYVDRLNITIVSNENFSGYTGYTIIEYTKTTN